VYPGDYDLLGFKIEEKFYIDKCMPMGCSVSCATFERFSTFFYRKAILSFLVGLELFSQEFLSTYLPYLL
jgi:hypothetical protein